MGNIADRSPRQVPLQSLQKNPERLSREQEAAAGSDHRHCSGCRLLSGRCGCRHQEGMGARLQALKSLLLD